LLAKKCQIDYIQGMAIAVKGIQYSYQIDFFNQVPTHVKSQVHDLPVLSVLQPTPLDRTQAGDTYLPMSDQAFSFAGPRATAPSPITSPLDPLPSIAPTSLLTALADPNGSPVGEPAGRVASTPQFASAIAEPAQIARSMPAVNANLRPASPLAAETETSSPLMPAELPNPLPETLPTAEARPDEQVKAVPRYEYNLALRAYKPDAGSFLQPGGYEKSDFARADFFAEPSRTVTEPPALPQASSQVAVNPLSESESKVQPAVAAREPTETAGEALLRNEREQPLTAKTEQPEQTQRLTGENFLARQAFRIYDMLTAPAMFNTGNLVDLRS
jgi:hypothetical protein